MVIRFTSIEHGVNSNSILNDLEYFHACSGALVPDIMHDILEGGLQYEAKLMLKKFIQDDKYFTLQDVNTAIECFVFGYAEGKNRPTPITTKTLSSSDNTLKQNGMLTLNYGGCFLASQILVATFL